MYQVTAGNLPPTLEMGEDGRIRGTTAHSDGPVWDSALPESLGEFDEFENVGIIQLTATPDSANQRTIDSYTITTDSYGMPWGLRISDDGKITGTVAELKYPQKFYFGEDERPTWTTPFGSLGTYDEGVSASDIDFTAVPIAGRSIAHYTVIDGALPWGIRMESNGNLRGNISDLKWTDGPWTPPFPLPVWTTPAGKLITLNEEENIALTITATSPAGRTISHYRVVDGNLPWGVRLDSDGVFRGSAAELKKYSPPEPQDAITAPVFSDTVLINTVPTTVLNGGSLGSFQIGINQVFVFDFTVAEGRSPIQIIIEHEPDYMPPFGFRPRNTNGLEPNTLLGRFNAETTKPGTYPVKVSILDSAYQKTSRTYSITLT
jgi:hypothetical protein